MAKMNLELIKKEQAFQMYKKLGSLKAVSELPGMPSYSILVRWKEEGKWDERIEQMKENLAKWEVILAKLESDSLLKDDVAHLMLLNKLLEKTIKAIVEKDLEPTSWKEAMETLKMIFEQKRLLLGRATNKSEIDIDFTSMEEHEIRHTLRKINELLQSVNNPITEDKQLKEAIEQKVKEENKVDSIQDKNEEEELAELSKKVKNRKRSFLDEIEIDEE